MTAKVITYKMLKEAIQVSFTGDDKIIQLYDPFKLVNTVDDIVTDILLKIKEYDDEKLVLNGIYEKNELVGYFVYRGGMLISFSINVKYRTRKYLREFFAIIREEIGRYFMCFLWSRNIRAIKYLMKHGMEITNSNNLITQLICP